MRLRKYQLAILAIIITNIVWGASSPIFKWALQDVTPFTFAFIRFLLASLIILPFVIHRLKITHRDFLKISLLSFVGFFLHISLLLFGLTLSSSINAPIISSSAPVFLFLGGFFLLREKVKWKTILGTLISLTGVSIIILRPLLDNGFDGSVIGNILFILATISFVLYTLLLKEYKLPYSSTVITFWMFAIATIIFFPFFLWESASVNIIEQLSLQAISGMLFGAVLTSVVGYVFYHFAIHHIKANETGVFLYIDPIVAALIAMPLLGEEITTLFLIGSAFVFLGLLVAEGKFKLKLPTKKED